MTSEYIYYLICPIDHKVKYVGKSRNPQKRYQQHVTKLDRLMTPKRQWLEGLFKMNLKPICKVIEEVNGDARDREQYHVALNKDTILNIHNPGKGIRSFSGKYPKKQKVK